MRRTRFVLALAASLAMLLFTTVPLTAAKHRTRAAASPSINPANFVRGVNNKFFPLPPGTTFFYEGEKEGVPTSNETFVTRKTKRILGVTCIVVQDRAFESGVLAEDTLDYYAQDTAGNVWYFGEDTKELDANGNVISTQGSWLAGVNGATPGIIMEANPKKNDQYDQENAPGVAQDQAKVLSLDKSATVPYGSFDDLLLTQESTPLDPKDVENKYYAAGIGFILGVAVKGGNERTELVRITVN